MKRIALLILALAFAVVPLLSQARAERLSFEVVSIKPTIPTPGGQRVGGGPRGDRYSMQGVTLKMLIGQAYQPLNNTTFGPGVQIQIIGGPNWADSDRYDIQAKADCSGGVLSREQMQQMIQSMLEDRFQLKAHKEMRDLPVYHLVVAKDGPKIKASEDQTPFAPPPGLGQPCGPAPATPGPPLPPPGQRGALPRGALGISINQGAMTLNASAVNIEALAGLLQQFVGRPVINKTDLKGLYDVKLQFGTEGISLPGFPGGIPQTGPQAPGFAGPGGAAAADPMPSLFTSIQELGLRLESTKGPVDVLVVDSAQKPTED